jgi:fatty-acyl-CoA synthase
MERFDVDGARAALERRHPEWVARTLHDAFERVAAEHGDRPFVIAVDGDLTYAELEEWSRRIARGLVAAGVEPGDRVALMLPNSAAFVAAAFAISRAGALAVPLHPRLHERELAFALRDSGAVVLLTVERFRDAPTGETLDGLAPGWHRGGGGPSIPTLRRVVLCEGVAPVTRPGATRLEQFERDADPDLDARLDARARAVDPDAGATLFYTSGTTGRAKGVELSHDQQLRSAYGSAYTRGFEDARRILFALPLHHVFAYIEGLLASMFVGGAVVCQPAFDPGETLAAIERHRVAEALFVPTMSLAVVEAAAGTDRDLSSLHAVMSAAATCPARLWRELVERLGVTELVTGYGMTETSAATTFTLPGDPIDVMVDTVGRPKAGGVAGDPALGGVLATYATVDPDSGAPLPEGTAGELVVSGPIVMRGYRDDADGNRYAFDADGRLRSGDLGRVRPDGYLELTGRTKDLYRCGAQSVMPAEVEDVLAERDDVEQAHVVAVPDERMGEVGCAFVVAVAGTRPDPDELIAYCREQLSRYKVPAYAVLVEASELPLTASGKVQKFVLAERATARLGPGRARVDGDRARRPRVGRDRRDVAGR